MKKEAWQVSCVPVLFNPVKNAKKKFKDKDTGYQAKLDAAYCGNNAYEICAIDMPAPPAEPPPPPPPPHMPPYPPLPPLLPGEYVTKCKDLKDEAWCISKVTKGKCVQSNVQKKCPKSCGRVCVQGYYYDPNGYHYDPRDRKTPEVQHWSYDVTGR